MSRTLKVVTGAALAAIGTVGVVFIALRSNGLDRLSQWVGIAGFIVSTTIGLVGVALAWLTFKQGSTTTPEPLLAQQQPKNDLVGSASTIQVNSDGLMPKGPADGYCYINRDGINALCEEHGIDYGYEPTLDWRIRALIDRLHSQGLLSNASNPTREGYVEITTEFKFMGDDESHLEFRASSHHFTMSMAKSKSTFWPHGSVMPPRSHVRIALLSGIKLRVFGEWMSEEYLRPHAASIVGYNLNRLNKLL